ncbi:MAG: hypothetical protein SVJ22_05150 [Halobacteriota archaeon]|nr:hypothetical protein [Halobacteriota archaeon]
MPKEVQDILEPDERVLLAFQEAGLGGELAELESIFLTDIRIIKMRPRTLGLRAVIIDYQCENMTNVGLNKGMLRSCIFIETRFQTCALIKVKGSAHINLRWDPERQVGKTQ